MAIKVFISHKLEDAGQAKLISDRLRNIHNIDTYLDVLDSTIGKNGEELAQYVRQKLESCTQLLAVMSPLTKDSWWVPWEIGVASEKEYPLATYGGVANLPDFLKRWPVLRNEQHLDAHALSSKKADSNRLLLERTATDSAARKSSTLEFYRSLRSQIGQ